VYGVIFVEMCVVRRVLVGEWCVIFIKATFFTFQNSPGETIGCLILIIPTTQLSGRVVNSEDSALPISVSISDSITRTRILRRIVVRLRNHSSSFRLISHYVVEDYASSCYIMEKLVYKNRSILILQM